MCKRMENRLAGWLCGDAGIIRGIHMLSLSKREGGKVKRKGRRDNKGKIQQMRFTRFQTRIPKQKPKEKRESKIQRHIDNPHSKILLSPFPKS